MSPSMSFPLDQQKKLVGLAYRITGSISEAEDIAQETLMKWLKVDAVTIQSPQAWLIKVATRKSLDYLKSARVQRESYIGPWLPEPYISEREEPESECEMDESISMALLLMLEKLNPAERASFILHDIFNYPFDEISQLLDKAEPNCRKLAQRARKKIESVSFGKRPVMEEHEKIVSAFFSAVKSGDVATLETVLSKEVIFHSDGGGKAIAARKLLSGFDVVSKFLVRAVKPSMEKIELLGGESSLRIWFNGAPGYLMWGVDDALPQSAFNFLLDGGKITAIHVLRNPDKLHFFEANKKK